VIRVVLFASLREALGEGMVAVSADRIRTVADVIGVLASERGDGWRDVLAAESVLVAVNQEMAGPGTRVTANDEVAFFPPVTGG